MVDKILVLGSNPQGTERIRIDREIREIQDLLTTINQRGRLLLESELALEQFDLNGQKWQQHLCSIKESPSLESMVWASWVLALALAKQNNS
ncbi:MAG: hypothetical protein QNJ18_04425 [Xenococcaceae cyanobacterium MO_167.B52]|nr:hypothetical protein [Xenococcaceae cyanobacterium MO_167.B52]